MVEIRKICATVENKNSLAQRATGTHVSEFPNSWGVWGGAVSPSNGVRGKAPEKFSFLAYF